MTNYDKWLDKDNPYTNETVLSQEEIDILKRELQTDIESVLTNYEELEADEILDVFKNFV